VPQSIEIAEDITAHLYTQPTDRGVVGRVDVRNGGFDMNAGADSRLSRQQVIVTSLGAAGLARSVAASHLGVSINTIKRHFDRAYRFLGVRSQNAATAACLAGNEFCNVRPIAHTGQEADAAVEVASVLSLTKQGLSYAAMADELDVDLQIIDDSCDLLFDAFGIRHMDRIVLLNELATYRQPQA
jgi:DNA-binding CsgD family transcriptional regulator